MRSSLAKCVVVTMLVFVLGAHWAFLQSVAWVGMVVTYSCNAPLTEALAKTFDGKHPCNICKLVRAGKASEQKQEAQKLFTKIEFFLQPRQSPLSHPAAFPPPTSRETFAFHRLEPPPTPPPRRLPA